MRDKECVLTEGKLCDHCGECEMCDLDPTKVCDNCLRCLRLERADYAAVVIDEIIEEEEGE